MNTYVCAFRGRRDSYQVPLALAEGSLLDQFITDAYAVPWLSNLSRLAPRLLREKAAFRQEPGIPTNHVRCLWGMTAVEHLVCYLGYSPTKTRAKLDPHFSWAAARRAVRTQANLFLYSPYAWEAFTAKYPHTPRKVLFQYHPHPTLEQRIFVEDNAKHPGFGESFAGERTCPLPEKLVGRERDCWRYADSIICASTFTRRSLLEAGCDERRCHIIPYGIDLPSVDPESPPTDSFHVLFVGSGGQRKGLHHLLLAWQKAALPNCSKLTLVCRIIDHEIERLAAATPRVVVIRGASQRQLTELYSSSCLFAMPSLVEGFGQVYLEALAQGCPVLGTANTCLPDLGGEAEGVFLVSPGNIDELTNKLETLGQILPLNKKMRMAARSCAAKFSWAAFRARIRTAAGDLHT
jgi:glycosyltransferase involved in cell wall biosynthesis